MLGFTGQDGWSKENLEKLVACWKRGETTIILASPYVSIDQRPTMLAPDKGYAPAKNVISTGNTSVIGDGSTLTPCG